ncbi:Apc13p protein-domain-containing protein [Astrocystis sublimbata]|nr:Apc13p protein-domain-containing protein [Astrocystis sublimbata]
MTIDATDNHNNNTAAAVVSPQPQLWYPFNITPSDKISTPHTKNLLHLSTMNKDGCYTYLHMQRSRDADLFEDFGKDKLPDDDIYVPPHHQPINPEDEDDVVPDQHAAFGIQKATQRSREPAWKDLDLAALMKKGPAPGRVNGPGGVGGGAGARKMYGLGKGLPR